MNKTELRRDVFYNPQFLSSRKYTLSESIDESFDEDQKKSEDCFHRRIKRFFDRTESTVTNGDQYYYRKFVDNTIPKLFEDYAYRIQQLYPSNGYSFLASSISKWLVKTISIIDLEYNKFKSKWIDAEFDEEDKALHDSHYLVSDNVYLPRFNATKIKEQLVIGTYKLYVSFYSFDQELPFGIIPYNFWTDSFEESVTKHKMIRSYARGQEGRAMTIVQENIRWFDAYVNRLWQDYVEYRLSCIGIDSYDPHEPDELQGMESTFKSLFSDYDLRLQKNGIADEDNACLIWLMYTINEIYRLFSIELNGYSDMEDDHETVLQFVPSFFIDKCMSELTGLLSNYLNDLCVTLSPSTLTKDGLESQSARIKELFTSRLDAVKKKELYDLLLDVAQTKKPYEAFAYIYIAQKKKLLNYLPFKKMYELLGKPASWKGNNYTAYLGKPHGEYRKSSDEYTDKQMNAISLAKEDINKIL